MDVGELLNVASSEIYQNCLSVFSEYRIPPTLATFALDRVYKLVQESALNETTKNLYKLNFQHEMLKASLGKGDKEDGDTA